MHKKLSFTVLLISLFACSFGYSQEQILYIETLIQSSESILKDLSNQYFLFKNIIEQTKFLSGA